MKLYFQIKNIKDKLINEFFTFINFKTVKDLRNNKEKNNDKDEKYTEEILKLLPL